MNIVVNHLTRMQPPYICVAGIDVDTGRHVRPVLRGARLERDLLTRKGGPFDIAAVVDIGRAWCVGEPPETEDYRFDPHRSAYVADLPSDEYWRLLQGLARTRLRDIFGDDLKQRGRTFAVDAGKGRCSLGCLAPAVRPALSIDLFGTVRLSLTKGRLRTSLAVTDLRLFEADHHTPRRSAVEHVARRINGGVEVILSVGLSRAWQKPGDTVARHWLQVNNLHLRDDPGWTERCS